MSFLIGIGQGGRLAERRLAGGEKNMIAEEHHQNGRGAWRGRGENLGGAVSLKKKKNTHLHSYMLYYGVIRCCNSTSHEIYCNTILLMITHFF